MTTTIDPFTRLHGPADAGCCGARSLTVAAMADALLGDLQKRYLVRIAPD